MILIRQSKNVIGSLSFDGDLEDVDFLWYEVTDMYEDFFGSLVHIGDSVVFENAVFLLNGDDNSIDLSEGRKPGRVYCAACDQYDRTYIIEQSKDRKTLRDFSLVLIEDSTIYQRKECSFSSEQDACPIRTLSLTRGYDYVINGDFVMSRHGLNAIDIRDLRGVFLKGTPVSKEIILDRWELPRNHELKKTKYKDFNLVKVADLSHGGEFWLYYKTIELSPFLHPLSVGAEQLWGILLIEVQDDEVITVVDIKNRYKKDNFYLLS